MAKIANGEYPRHVFARRLREARKRRGWDQKDLAAALSAIEYKLDVSQISKIEKGTRQVSVEDLLAIAAAGDWSPIQLLANLEDDAVMRVTEGLPDFTAATFRDWFRGKIPLRFRLGVGTERDSLAFLNETPDAELRMGARAMGLTDDQAEDALAGIRTGVMPWPTGDPRMKDSTKESNDA